VPIIPIHCTPPIYDSDCSHMNTTVPSSKAHNTPPAGGHCTCADVSSEAEGELDAARDPTTKSRRVVNLNGTLLVLGSCVALPMYSLRRASRRTAARSSRASQTENPLRSAGGRSWHTHAKASGRPCAGGAPPCDAQKIIGSASCWSHERQCKRMAPCAAETTACGLVVRLQITQGWEG
jgi:hypothetical protein